MSPKADGSSESWWRRNTSRKGFVITVVGALVGLVGLAVTLVPALRPGAATDAPRDERVRRAPAGSLDLPESVPEGPARLVVPGAPSGRSGVPVVGGEYGTPRFTGDSTRRSCEDFCSFDLAFEGAAYLGHDKSPPPASFYVTVVFPAGAAHAPVPVASASSPDGTGSVVVDVPFLNGWTCVRMVALFGPRYDVVAGRTPWSEAACLHLDLDGHVADYAELP